MKYSDKKPPLVCMIKQSPCYKRTYRMKPKGVLWHDTGANNPTLKRYVQPTADDPNRQKLLNTLGVNKNGNDWNNTTREVGVNAFVGKLANGVVTTVQTMPLDYRPWGCGGGKYGSCNDNWVQFEICEDGLNDKAYFDACYKEACELTAYLCQMYNIDPHGTVNYNGVKVPTILCHWDSYKLGLGSGHSDVYDWFNIYGKTMDNVRNDVANLLKVKDNLFRVRLAWADGDSQVGAYKIYENAVQAANEYPGYAVYDVDGNELYRSKEEEEVTYEEWKKFMAQYRKDLQDNDSASWSEADREWAINNGLIKGNGQEIDGIPNYMWQDFLSREQVVAILHRFAEQRGLE